MGELTVETASSNPKAQTLDQAAARYAFMLTRYGELARSDPAAFKIFQDAGANAVRWTLEWLEKAGATITPEQKAFATDRFQKDLVAFEPVEIPQNDATNIVAEQGEE